MHLFFRRAIFLALLLQIGLFIPSTGMAVEWVPSDEDIQKYRKSWNPFSHGPILLQAVDIQPQGQMSVRPFVFSQIGEHSYGNRHEDDEECDDDNKLNDGKHKTEKNDQSLK